jgi:hypothetical protein
MRILYLTTGDNMTEKESRQEINASWVPFIDLSECDGNAFGVLGMVARALRDEGATKEYRDQFHAEATSGDYDHLLQTVMRYCEVQYRVESVVGRTISSLD